MAINDQPLFAPGRNLSPDDLQRMLGLRPADWSAPQEGGVGDASGGFVDPTRQSQGWALDTGRFAPTLYYDPTYDGGGNGRSHDNGARYATGGGQFRVVQPRNVSTWGNSDSYDVWDDKGVWQGVETDGTALRGLVNMGLLAAGANNLPPAALKGAGTGALVTAASGGDYSDITSAAAKGAVTGTVAHGINTYGAEQGWNPAVTRAVSGGATTAIRGGDGSDVLRSGVLAGVSGLADTPTTTTTTGNAAMFTLDPSLYPDLNGVDTGQLLTDNSFDGSDVQFDLSGTSNPTDLGFDASLFNGPSNGGTMDLGTLAKVAGAIYGASQSRDRTQTSTQTRDPWAPAQPYLLDQLAQVAALQKHYQANPINDIQKAAANQKLGLLSGLNNQVLPGLLSGMSTLSAGYQRPGGPPPRASGMNYDPSALVAGMQGNNIDWSRMFPRG